MKKTILIAASIAALAGCSRDADVASRNLSRAADMFEITRRVVFKPQVIIPDIDARGDMRELTGGGK